jgi:hypothetical protein
LISFTLLKDSPAAGHRSLHTSSTVFTGESLESIYPFSSQLTPSDTPLAGFAGRIADGLLVTYRSGDFTSSVQVDQSMAA